MNSDFISISKSDKIIEFITESIRNGNFQESKAIPSINSTAQKTEKNVPDSLRIRPVSLSEIPTHSAEILVKTKNILKNLMSAEEISTLKHMNDSILNLVEEKKVRKEVSTQHVDLHQQVVKVREKERNGVKNQRMKL